MYIHCLKLVTFLLFLIIFPLFSSASQFQSCSVCENLSDSACLTKLQGIVSSLDSDTKYELYMEMFPSGNCDGLTKSQCVATMGTFIANMEDDKKLKPLEVACAQGTLAIPSSDLDDCNICEGMDTDSCLHTLQSFVDLMSDSERLTFQQNILHYSHCQGLDTASCLSTLDSFMNQLSSSQLFNTLYDACIEGELDTAKISGAFSEKESVTCSVCHGVSDTECLSILDGAISTMSEEQKLNVLLTAFPDQKSSCMELTSSQCLSKIERVAKSLPLKQRMTVLIQSCENIQQVTDGSYDFNKLSEVDTSSCSLCASQSGSQCLTTLTSQLSSLDAQQKEKSLALLFDEADCLSSTSTSCLSSFEERLEEMSSKNLLTFLADGCSKGVLTSSYSDCDICENANDNTCLHGLETFFNSLDYDSQISIIKSTSNIDCSSLSSEECLELLKTSSNKERLDILGKACVSQTLFNPIVDENLIETNPTSSKELEITESSSSAANNNEKFCSLCGDISNDECHDVLLLTIKNYKFIDRLNVLKKVFHSKCRGVKKDYCVLYLQEMLFDLSYKSRSNLLIDSCKNGFFITQEKTSDCPVCDSLNVGETNSCTEYLSDYLKKLPNQVRLEKEKEMFTNDLCSSDLSDSECLEYLDVYIQELSPNEQINVFYDACANGAFDYVLNEVSDFSTNEVPNYVLNEETKQCDLCYNQNDLTAMPDTNCYNTLVQTLSSFDSQHKLFVKQKLLDQSCDELADEECSASLDLTFSTLNFKTQLKLLKTGCENGLFQSISDSFTSTTTIEFIASETQSFGIWVLMIGMIAIIVGVLTYANRKRLMYSPIPTVEIEI